MYAITGITGQVGGRLARELLGAGVPLRAVLRDRAKAAPWAARGCEVAVAAMDDALALRAAFGGAEAVFVLLPPVFDPTPGFAETRAAVAALVEALQAAAPARVVALSTIGAQAAPENLLTQLQLMERGLAALSLPVAFLRAAWFIENSAHDLEAARLDGAMNSFLQPLDRPVAMVSTADVARHAAQLLRQTWSGRRIVELEGPSRVSPNQLAAALGRALQREVGAHAVPRAEWDAMFRAQGMANPGPRMRML
ncbi:MAG TPA: NAD(P)H-binding protein, partial [Burkholderiaceae bacterium]